MISSAGWWQNRIKTPALQVTKFKMFFILIHRWRAGQTVSADEQLNFSEMEESMSVSMASNAPVAFDRAAAQLSLTSSHISLEDRKNLEEEREKLFQLLDAKDDEIQEQSQLVEKLKEQMLEQEELIMGTRRDYENLSREMNKIQVLFKTNYTHNWWLNKAILDQKGTFKPLVFRATF